MKNEDRVVFEVQMINTSALNEIKILERDGILKRVRVTNDGKLDMRMVKR